MPLMSIPGIVLNALNHVIGQEKWASDLLQRHEHKFVRVSLPVADFQIVIQDGLLINANDPLVEPSVSLEISQEAIWSFLKDGKSGAMKFVRISGDVDLAADLNRLVADLQWEAEEDLAKIIGDAPSRRIFTESNKVIQQASKAVDDLKVGVRDYLVYEKNVLLGTDQFNAFKAELRLLRDHLERTEKKVEQIELALEGKEKQ